MSRIKYVHVIEYEDGRRLIAPGKGHRSGTNVILPAEDDESDDWERMDWERVDYWRLPESMPKSEFTDWWNTQIENAEAPDPIPEVLDAMGVDDGE